MLDGPPGDLAATREEAGEEVGEVDWGVDVDGREGRAGESSGNERVRGELCEL